MSRRPRARSSAPVRTLLRSLGLPAKLVTLLLALGAAAGWWLQQDAPKPRQPDQPGQSYVLSGRVVEVADGDTLTLQAEGGRRRIRLASIDAPEKGDAGRPGQPFGRAAGRHLAQLLPAGTLQARCYERDQYDRDVCDLMLPDGSTANRRQVQAGMAWANMQGQGRYMRDDALPAMQQAARQAGHGLWSQPGWVEPWVWRYRCWNQGQC